MIEQVLEHKTSECEIVNAQRKKEGTSNTLTFVEQAFKDNPA
jgi:hypothetical protein